MPHFPRTPGELIVNFKEKAYTDSNTLQSIFAELGYRLEQRDDGIYNCYVPPGTEKAAIRKIQRLAITLGNQRIPLVEWADYRNRHYDQQYDALDTIVQRVEDLQDDIGSKNRVSHRTVRERLRQIIAEETKNLKD